MSRDEIALQLLASQLGRIFDNASQAAYEKVVTRGPPTDGTEAANKRLEKEWMADVFRRLDSEETDFHVDCVFAVADRFAKKIKP